MKTRTRPDARSRTIRRETLAARIEDTLFPHSSLPLPARPPPLGSAPSWLTRGARCTMTPLQHPRCAVSSRLSLRADVHPARITESGVALLYRPATAITEEKRFRFPVTADGG